MREKYKIYQEAFSIPGNVKATGRKYNVEPAQIRRWKRQHELFCQEFDKTTQENMLSVKVINTRSVGGFTFL